MQAYQLKMSILNAIACGNKVMANKFAKELFAESGEALIAGAFIVVQ